MAINSLPFGEKYVKPILEFKISGTDLFKIRNFLCCYIDEDLYKEINVAVSYGDDLESYNDFLFKWLIEIYSTVPQLINHEYSMALPVYILDCFMEVFGSLDGTFSVKSIYNTYRKKKSEQDAD